VGGGGLNGVSVGAITPSTGAFTELTANNATVGNVVTANILTANVITVGSINATSISVGGGGLNGVSVGAISPSTGAFTELSDTGNLTVGANTTIGGWTSIASNASIGGNIVIGGNIDIGANLSVAGVFGVNQYLYASPTGLIWTTVTPGATTITDTVITTFHVQNNTPSTDSITGAVTVDGGVGIAGNLNVAGTANIAGNTNITGRTSLANVTIGNVLANLNVTGNISTNAMYVSGLFWSANSASITDVNPNPTLFSNATSVGTTIRLVDTVPVLGNSMFRWSLVSKDTINNTFKSSTIDALTDGTNVYFSE
jgi:hypothetical protein